MMLWPALPLLAVGLAPRRPMLARPLRLGASAVSLGLLIWGWQRMGWQNSLPLAAAALIAVLAAFAALVPTPPTRGRLVAPAVAMAAVLAGEPGLVWIALQALLTCCCLAPVPRRGTLALGTTALAAAYALPAAPIAAVGLGFFAATLFDGVADLACLTAALALLYQLGPDAGPMLLGLGAAGMAAGLAAMWRGGGWRAPRQATLFHFGVAVFAAGLGGAAALAGLLHWAAYALGGVATDADRSAVPRWCAAAMPPSGLFVTTALLAVACTRQAPLLAAPFIGALALASGAVLARLRGGWSWPGRAAVLPVWLPLGLGLAIALAGLR